MNNQNQIDSLSYAIEIEKNALIFFREYAFKAFLGLVSSLWICAIIVYIELQTLLPIYWIICVTVIELISLCFRRSLPNSMISRPRKLKLAALLNLFDGLIIGSCIILIPYVSDIVRTILVYTMVASCLGATITTLGYQLFFLCYSVPVAISFLLSSLLSIYFWDGSYVLYAVFITSFAIYIFIVSLSQDIYRNYQQAFKLNLRNKEINQELKIAVKEAKQANESKTRFLASASHDLRQPINTISLFIATLSLKKLNPDDAQIVTHMASAVNTMDTQLNSLLEMSKLDSGIITAKNKNINIAPILENMMAIYSDQNIGNDLSFDFICTTDKTIVNTDQMLFERIIQNIVGNSIKYTPSGKISMTLEEKDENYLSIIVNDTGVGISKENLSKIYDEFYQVENQARDPKKGFGLGMSIVKRLCHLLDIEIEIKSILGEGTSVQLNLHHSH